MRLQKSAIFHGGRLFLINHRDSPVQGRLCGTVSMVDRTVGRIIEPISCASIGIDRVSSIMGISLFQACNLRFRSRANQITIPEASDFFLIFKFQILKPVKELIVAVSIEMIDVRGREKTSYAPSQVWISENLISELFVRLEEKWILICYLCVSLLRNFNVIAMRIYLAAIKARIQTL
jgi:hypothetical protein